MGIYSYELFNTFGVDQIIRVGTCGAVNRDVEVGSLILAMGCCSNSNFASQYHLPGIFAPLADYGLLESAVGENGRSGTGNGDYVLILYRSQSRKESAHHADCRKQHPQQQSPYK